MISLSAIDSVGSNLARPECVLCTANGRSYVSNWEGGITVLEPDGSQWQLLAGRADFEILPNGITLLSDGSVLLSHLGPESGGVFRLDEDSELTPFLTEVDQLPASIYRFPAPVAGYPPAHWHFKGPQRKK